MENFGAQRRGGAQNRNFRAQMDNPGTQGRGDARNRTLLPELRERAQMANLGADIGAPR